MPSQIPIFPSLTSIQKPIFTLIPLSLLFIFYLFTTTTTKTTISTTTKTTNFTTPSPYKHNPSPKATQKTSPFISHPQLDFSSHHSSSSSSSSFKKPLFKKCPQNFTNYCPCQDSTRVKKFPTKRFFHRERHCPEKGEKLKCLIPKPYKYRRPFGWPKSKDMAWYVNVPFKRLTVDKKKQNWVKLVGDLLVFPGGGTSFTKGVRTYIDLISKILPLKSGAIRTALDVGCGVGSFGAALLNYNILTMSIAPVDIHEAQVQFALERGLPAMVGILSTYRLPYPSRSFDLAHCSRCLVKWTSYDGLYLLEVDRILRPGGYWVLSGPPINWKVNYKGWERTTTDLNNEQMNLEDLARRMCWEKIAEKGPVAVWQKPTNHIHCAQKLKAWKSLRFCDGSDPEFAWYAKMEACITPLPKVQNIKDISGGALKKWPGRLNVAPPRIESSKLGAITAVTFDEDNQVWKRRVRHYGSVLDSLFKGGYRNVMDMNAGLGGFAAALSAYPVWVMNVVPYDSQNNTLGVVYERGLIGSYMNWCEAFSTYPRTYDLIHADGVFSMYMNRCDMEDILLEMYRIVRPHGGVIVRDHVDMLVKVRDLMRKMGWKSKLSHSELGPHHPHKVLFVDNSDPSFGA